MREEQWDEAAAQFTAVLDAHPCDLDARVGRAAAHVGARAWAAARADLDLVLAIAPDHAAAGALARVLPPP